MTLLSLSNVGISFGATELFKNVTFTVAEGERWGIIGRNGAGKTSIFKVITGELQPTAGSVARKPGLRHALLDQHRAFEGATTVWEAGAAAWREVIALEQRIAEQADARWANWATRVTDEFLEKFGHDQERFADLGGYIYHARVDAVLQGLGFDAEESKTRLVSTLSGGERGRVGLAAQLIAPADLLLLDEPTNHLDLDTTTWLQEWLSEADETVIVVSHDRAFLDAICTQHPARRGEDERVVQGELQPVRPAARRATAHARARAGEAARVREEGRGVHPAQHRGRELLPGQGQAQAARAPAAARAAAGRSRGDDAAIRRRRARRRPGGRRSRICASKSPAACWWTTSRRCSRRNDFVALVGPNGAGKSSFISTILGDRAAAGGEARVGGSITPAWFRQDLSDLPIDKSLSDAINDLRPLWNRGQVQNHLGAFGFSGEEVFREIRTLSGGERARMALARITLTRANLLVLDEPTNHLDVENIEVLEDALDEYEGTVLLVSHDRAFLREVATRVWWFDGTRSGRLRRTVRRLGGGAGAAGGSGGADAGGAGR